MSLWTHQNLFRDQGGRDLGDKGKELCDAVAIFGNNVVLFSDKVCKFPTASSIEQSWARWHRRAILESADQLFGAERWLKNHPSRVFIDQACTTRLKLPIPKAPQARYHRIAVASGAAAACAAFFHSRGTLVVCPAEPLPKTDRNGVVTTTPFFIGEVDQGRGFVHVLDELALDLVLKELDTAPDFINYLAAKEELIRSGRLALATGEEEILGFYIKHRYLGSERAFDGFRKATKVVLDSGFWDSLVANPAYVAKKKADRVSYLWDSIIEEFATVGREGRLVVGSAAAFEDHEAILRALASRTRFERRILAHSLSDAVERAGIRDQRLARMDLPQDGRDTAHVFLAVPKKDFMGDEGYREYRRQILMAYCQVVGMQHRRYREIIGIATEAGVAGAHSHDIVKYDNTQWTPEQEVLVLKLQADLQIVQPKNMTARRSRPLEFPSPADLSEPRTKKIGANQPCPCGSGKKYKRCCDGRVGRRE